MTSLRIVVVVIGRQFFSSVVERDMNDNVLKAIIKIREKDRKRPCKETIYRYFTKSGLTYSISELEAGLQRLVMEGQIENRGEPGKDSLFILDGVQKDSIVPVNDDEGKDVATAVKYTPYDDFLQLRAKVEILLKAYEGSHAAKGTSHSDLKEEIQLLRKENESLRNEIRRKEILINSIQVDNPSFRPNFHQDTVFDPRWRCLNKTRQQIPGDNTTNTTLNEDLDNSVEFEIPKKRQTKGMQSPKPTWEPIDIDLNRYVAIARPSLESTGPTTAAVSNPKSNPNSAEFQIPKKCHTTKIQSPKPTWEPIDVDLNRYASIARPSVESTYATAVKNTSEFQMPNKDTGRNLHRGQDKISDKQEKYKQNRYVSLRRPTQEHSIEIIGDSLIKDVKGYKMNEATGRAEKIYVKSFSGATTDDMNSHVVPTIKRNPQKIILHCGTNDIRSQATPENIAKEVMELAVSLSTKENTIFVSGIVPRGDNWNNKVSEINKHLQSACSSRNMPFIDNSNISPDYHLNRSRIHLNPEGTRTLANNFLFYLGY